MLSRTVGGPRDCVVVPPAAGRLGRAGEGARPTGCMMWGATAGRIFDFTADRVAGQPAGTSAKGSGSEALSGRCSLKFMTVAGPRRRRSLRLFMLVLVSVAAGYVFAIAVATVSYTHLRAHETVLDL